MNEDETLLRTETTKPIARRSLTVWCLVLCLLPLCGFVFRFRDLIPFWDGSVYARCAMELSRQQPLFPIARCALGDPVISYLLPLWLGYVISGYKVVSLYITNLCLVGVLLYSILVILRNTILRNPQNLWGYLIPLTLWAYDPLFITHIFVLTPDLGATVFCTGYIAALVSGHVLVAALLGILAVFSKASALAPFGLLSVTALVYTSAHMSGSLKVKLKCFASRFIFTAILPLAVFWMSTSVLHIFPASYDSDRLKNSCMSQPNSLFDLFFTVRLFDAKVYLFNIFFLNFHWIETLIIVLCSVIGLFRRLRPPYPLKNDAASFRFFSIALCFLAVTTYTATRCQHYNNPKYILSTVPFFHLTFLCSMHFAGLRRALTNLLILLLVPLHLVSTVATIDPVSRLFYGTFLFGERPLLAMTSKTSECCGDGRDQTSYNVEHLLLDEIVAKILHETNASPDAPFVIHDLADFLFLSRETPEHSRCISLYEANCVNDIPVLTSNMVMSVRPRSFMYIDFPFIPKRLAVTDFEQDYSLVETKRFSSGRHAIDTYRYTRKRTP